MELALELKSALAGAQGIRINEICFVATDSRMKDAGMAAQLAAVTLGNDSDHFKRWLNDPQKLLEMIAAAQGSKGVGIPGTAIGAGEEAGLASGTGVGSVSDGNGTDAAAESRPGANAGVGLSGGTGNEGAGLGRGPGAGAAEPSEAEIYRILTALTSLSNAGVIAG